MASVRNGVFGASGPKIWLVMLALGAGGAAAGLAAEAGAAGAPNAGSAMRRRISISAPTQAVTYSSTTITAIQVKMCSCRSLTSPR